MIIHTRHAYTPHTAYANQMPENIGGGILPAVLIDLNRTMKLVTMVYVS